MMSGPFQAKSRGIGQGSGGRQDPGRLLLFVLVEVRWFVFSWVKPEKDRTGRRGWWVLFAKRDRGRRGV